MVVDDEFALRTLVARGFRQRGHEVVEVCDGLMALGVVQAAWPPVDLVVTNSLHPPVTGVELVARLREIRPTLSVIHLLANHESKEHWFENTPPGGIPTVFKAFNLWDLLEEAEHLLQGR